MAHTHSGAVTVPSNVNDWPHPCDLLLPIPMIPSCSAWGLMAWGHCSALYWQSAHDWEWLHTRQVDLQIKVTLVTCQLRAILLPCQCLLAKPADDQRFHSLPPFLGATSLLPHFIISCVEETCVSSDGTHSFKSYSDVVLCPPSHLPSFNC